MDEDRARCKRTEDLGDVAVGGGMEDSRIPGQSLGPSGRAEGMVLLLKKIIGWAMTDSLKMLPAWLSH